jgi:two-component system chemotaxis sensor kinase CheA
MARDRLRYFRIESRELLEQLGQGVLDLEKQGPEPDLVARLLRFAHTLKGAARVVKQLEIAERAHEIEEVLGVFRGGTTAVSRQRVDGLLGLLDDIGTRVASLAPAAETTAAPQAGAATPEAIAADDVFHAFRPDIAEMDGLLDTMAEAHGHLVALGPLLSRVEQTRHLADLVLDHLASPLPAEVSGAERGPDRSTRSMAEELRSTIGALERDFSHRVDQLGRELKEARSAAERLRLVPASALFTFLERTARDAARSLGRQVSFAGRGGDIRVEAQVLATVQSALLHVIRNAVAHGIEPPADRAAAGKPACGQITLQVVRRGQRVAFSCADDGRGVDFDAVRRMARQRGLVPPTGEPLRAEDVIALLLKGGISTSGTVTDVAGRGIGMNVVREAAGRLGGEVHVHSQAGSGTTIEILVPLTLAALHALTVESGGAVAILPLDAVRALVRVTPGSIVRTGDQQSIVYEGETIQLKSLARALVDEAVPPQTGIATAVIVQGPISSAAFLVDRVLGTTDIVLRPLPELAGAAPFVAGVSLDEEGVPRPVLEPEALVADAEGSAMPSPAPASPARPILVVDDSLTTRMLEQSILESAGYQVELATSGEEALEKARATPYGLFLVDVEMPGMDGFTFIERTRTQPDLRSIPAILVTSRRAPEDFQRGKDVGASAYIVKSEFDQGVLLSHIRELVG